MFRIFGTQIERRYSMLRKLLRELLQRREAHFGTMVWEREKEISRTIRKIKEKGDKREMER
jgi:hypothetical protein